MKKILIVEPDFALSKTYFDYLKSEKYKVRVAYNAQQAIHEIDKNQPDLIILELQLPSHSGFEFIYELRSYPEWLNLPIVVNSFIPKETLEIVSTQLKQFGIVDYLYKPSTSLRDLSYVLRHHIAAAI